MKSVVFLLALASATVNEIKFCKSSFDFKFRKVQAKNQLANLDFCIEHAPNTCCMLNHADAIRLRVEKMPADDKCRAMSA